MASIWTIYCHIHNESGRRYVGLTKLSVMKRWNRHVYNAVKREEKTHFANAIRKYGKDSFSHEVLETCDSVEAANSAEDRWIKKFDSRNDEKGFNVAPGGQHTPHPVRNPWDRPGFREANAGRNAHHLLTPEARERQKASLRSPESRSKRSGLAKEALARPETVEKRRLMREDPAYKSSISSSLKATLSDPSVRAEMSSRTVALHQDPSYKEKVSVPHSAAMTSPEVRAKLSASSRRAWADPEKMIGMTGHHLSDETKAKISAASTGRRHTPESVAEQRRLYLERSSVCLFCGSRIEGKRSCVRGRVCCLVCRSMQDSGLVSFLRPDGLPVMA